MSQDRRYYDDAYTTEFTATVAAVEVEGGGRARVLLESSYFYPTSGGQMHDRGRLGDGEVIDVFEEDGRVVHLVTGLTPPMPGDRLQAVIDASRRRNHRQQHTGQHVLSRVVEDRLGLPTLSSRLGETGNTLDLATSSLDLHQLDAIEDEANTVVWEGRPVHVRYVAAENAKGADLRKIPPREGRLRVIEVEDHDLSACGGTHVRNTAEIGMIAITKLEKVKGGQRVHFLCGDRALRYRRGRDRLVTRLSHVLTTGEDEMDAAAVALVADAKKSHKRIAQLERERLLAEIEAWIEGAPHVGPVRLVARALPGDLAQAAGDAAQAMMRHPGLVVVLTIDEGERTQVLLGRSADVVFDCASMLQSALAARGGRGGGQPHYARGSAPGSLCEEIEAVVRAALA